MMVPNRLAVEGEELVAHRFRTGTVGLVSCRDLDMWNVKRSKSLWQRIKDGFSTEGGPGVVVCVPPGARLWMMDAPVESHSKFPAPNCRDAVFTQISAEVNEHRDALSFPNGTTVLLQLLPEGQRLKVLWLPSGDDVPQRQPHPEFARSA